MRRLLLIAGMCLIASLTSQAQDDAAGSLERDPISLAQRFLDYDDTAAFALPRPYSRIEEFWVPRAGERTPVRIRAVLAGSADNTIRIWIEEGIQFNPELMDDLADDLADRLNWLRDRANYELNNYLAAGDPANFLPVPDVDGDPYLNILFTTDLAGIQLERLALFNPLDSLPAAITPGSYSNQREMAYVSIVEVNNQQAPFNDIIYYYPLSLAMYRFIILENNPDEARWLREALGVHQLIELRHSNRAAYFSAYFKQPEHSILRPLSAAADFDRTVGGQQLFLSYFAHRFNRETFLSLFTAPGAGIAPLDDALEQNSVVDPLTGATITGRDVFSDFIMTNLVNFGIGDGRFLYPEDVLPNPMEIEARDANHMTNIDLADQTVEQYGAYYLRLTHPNKTIATIQFEGDETVPVLPLPSEPGNHFYWSGNEPNRDHTLTRTFDLTGVDAATLNFRAWWMLASVWDYVYVTVSTNGGATWTILKSNSTTDENWYGAAYGPGFTSRSQPPGANQAIWTLQQVDLSEYVGREILLRFEYMSLPHQQSLGFALDDVSIPEIGFSDDAERESDWDMHGWRRSDNQAPARYVVQAATTGTTTHPPVVRRLIDPNETAISGEWQMLVEPAETLMIAISAVGEAHHQPATFDIRITGSDAN